MVIYPTLNNIEFVLYLKTIYLPLTMKKFYHFSIQFISHCRHIIKSPRYTGGDFMFLYRFVRRRQHRHRPQILVHVITFEQLLGFLAATMQLYEWFSPSVRPSVCLSVGMSVCRSVCPSYLFSCDQAALWMVFSVCLSVCPSVCLSVTPFWLCSHHRIIMKFQELSPRTRVTSMQKVKVRGQRSRSQRSQPNLTVSGL